MLRELGITDEQFDQVITTHENFLNNVEENELIAWSDALMDTPSYASLLFLHASIRNSITKTDEECGSLYSLSGGKTFLTLRFLLKRANIAIDVTEDDTYNYAAQTLYNLCDTYNEKSKRKIYLDEAEEVFYQADGYPPRLNLWMADFFDGNSHLADLLLPSKNDCPDDNRKYIERGITDIACPMSLAIENFTWRKEHNHSLFR